MPKIRDIHLKCVLAPLINRALDMGARNVRLAVGNGRGNTGQDSFYVVKDHPNLNWQDRGLDLVPGHIDATLGVSIQSKLTIGGVYGDTFATSNKTDDLISRHRVAALAEAHQHIVD